MRGMGFKLSIFLLAAISVSYSTSSSAAGVPSAAGLGLASEAPDLSSQISSALKIRKCLTEVENSLVSYSLDKNLAEITTRVRAQLQRNLEETAELLEAFNQQSSSLDEVDATLLSASLQVVEQATSFSKLSQSDRLLPFLVEVTISNEYPATCLSPSTLTNEQMLSYKLSQSHVYFNMGLGQMDYQLAKMNKRLRVLKKKQMSDPKVSGLTRV